jgi:hypothetical protein
MADPFRAQLCDGAFKRRFDCERPFAEQTAELSLLHAAGLQLE